MFKHNRKFGSIELSSEVTSHWAGDERIGARLSSVIESIAKRPEKSFQNIFGGTAQIEGFYRLVRNKNVSTQDIAESHLSNTAERITWTKEDTVLVVHDTSVMSFNRRTCKDKIGWLGGNQGEGTHFTGFLGHFALAVSQQGMPLGVIGLQTIQRRPGDGKRRRPEDPRRESQRWVDVIGQVQSRVNFKKQLVHVMDREADTYEIYSELSVMKGRFVIRLAKDRVIEALEKQKISEALECSEIVCKREVSISPRSKTNAGNVKRKRRNASLAIRVSQVAIKRPQRNPNCPRSLMLNVVHVFEKDTPEGCEGVDWKLVTTEPIETEEQVLRIIDIYRMRWIIEEFFKALKTGCAYE